MELKRECFMAIRHESGNLSYCTYHIVVEDGKISYVECNGDESIDLHRIKIDDRFIIDKEYVIKQFYRYADQSTYENFINSLDKETIAEYFKPFFIPK